MQRTLIFKNRVEILTTNTICGPKEALSDLGKYFDKHIFDDSFGEKTFEKAECKMLSYVIEHLLKNGKLKQSEIDSIISGDLLNQIISSSFASREYSIAYIGVYNACSTIVESMILGSCLLSGGFMQNVICATGSHFSTAERQYRYPLELGSVRPPQSQWTVTGSGGMILSSNCSGNLPYISSGTFGKVIDYGVKDANNMGAAMAPSAVDTLLCHFKNTNTTIEDYDLVITGDLGVLGSSIFEKLMREKKVAVGKKHVDCGAMIYNYNKEEFQGGSGAGCSAIVFCGYFYKKLLERKYKKIILIATGALLSAITTFQGESIPGISHLVVVEID